MRPSAVSIIPTGSLKLDIALDIGGIPRGWMTEIYGPPSSGKTTLALHMLAQAQRLDLTCLFIDVENGLNPAHAVACGIDAHHLLIANPADGTQALEMCTSLLQSTRCDLVVIDSLAALTASDEGTKSIGRDRYGKLNPLLASHLRKISQVCKATGGTLICTNQTRKRIRTGYGTPETTPGGLTVKFHAAVRIALQIEDTLQRGETPYGVRILAQINKNRFSPKKHSTIIEIVYNKGIDKSREIFSLGKKLKIITKHGSQYYYRNQNLGQGQAAAQRSLQEKEGIVQAIEREIRRAHFLPGTLTLSA